jgi:hypothetical protein
METGGSLPQLQEPPPVSILSQIIPIHALPSCLRYINFNISPPPYAHVF